MNKKARNVIIAVILIVILVACTVAITVALTKDDKGAGELISVTELVTDENGEPVTDAQGELVTEVVEAVAVTGENGEVVTEIVTNSKTNEPYTYKNGTTVTRVVTTKKSQTTTGSNNASNNGNGNQSSGNDDANDNNNVNNNNNSNSNQTPDNVVTQPEAPAVVTGLKVSAVTKDSITVKWNNMKCDGYQIRYKKTGATEYSTPVDTTATNAKLTGLTSYTNYTIEVRGYNGSGDIRTASKEWATVKQRTDENKDPRKINITYILPQKGSRADTMVIEVRKNGSDEWVKDDEISINADGMQYGCKTKNEYKGLVEIRLTLKSINVYKESELTDKDSVTIDLTDTNIAVVPGEDD